MADYRAFMAKLNRETESELIAWIEAQGGFTELLRELATAAMNTDQVTHADLLQAIGKQEPITHADLFDAINSLSVKIDKVTVTTSTATNADGDVDGTQEAAGNLAAWDE
jgi:hypothetical protein